MSLSLGQKSPGSKELLGYQAALGHRVLERLGKQQAGLKLQVRAEGWAVGNAPNREDSVYILPSFC